MSRAPLGDDSQDGWRAGSIRPLDDSPILEMSWLPRPVPPSHRPFSATPNASSTFPGVPPKRG